MTNQWTGGRPASQEQWASWNSRNAARIGLDDYGYESLFASNVLPLVTGLRPADVTPQKEILLDGRYRRIDFAVERPGLKVAIEIDGWDKTGTGMGMNRKQHQDFLDRQNALVLAGWTPLRFTPVEVRDQPTAVARRIDSAIETAIETILGEMPKHLEARDPLNTSYSHQTSHTPETSPAVPTQPASGPSTATHWGIWAGAAVVAAVAIALISGNDPTTVSCEDYGVVRGNVSQSGELIYHLPGDQYYDVTVPEQCFATPSDAQESGYRHSLR